MTGDQEHFSPSSQGAYQQNIFVVGDMMGAIFPSKRSSYWDVRSGIGVFTLNLSSVEESGLSILNENTIEILISTGSEEESIRDLITIKNALKNYHETLLEMIYHSRVNIIMASLGEVFSAAVTPEIAEISSQSRAITIGILVLPHPDDGNRALQHSRFALENIKPHLDAMILLPMENLYNRMASSTTTNHIGQKIATMISRIARGVVDGMNSSGFHDVQQYEDLLSFFNGAGELLISYKEIELTPNGTFDAIDRCIHEPFHPLRRFEGAQKIYISVCNGEAGLLMEDYLRIGQFCRNNLGNATNTIIKPFQSTIRGEAPFIVVFGRDITERRSDGFDYPYAEIPEQKAPSMLPAYYRKYYGAKRRAISHDVSNF